MRTSFKAVSLAIPAYFSPFVFAYNDALLFQGSLVDVVLVTCTTFFAGIAIAAGLIGYFLRSCNWLRRGILFLCGLLLIIQSLWAHLAGIAIFVALCAEQWCTYTKDRSAIKDSDVNT